MNWLAGFPFDGLSGSPRGPPERPSNFFPSCQQWQIRTSLQGNITCTIFHQSRKGIKCLS